MRQRTTVVTGVPGRRRVAAPRSTLDAAPCPGYHRRMTPSNDPDDPVIARLAVPMWRRVVGMAVLALLVVLLARLAWTESSTGRQAGLILAMLGGGFLLLGLWRATAGAVLLRASGRLETSGGRVLALPDEIASVETGAFAVRPSNGFMLRLRSTRRGPGWAPGLWWRLGRRLGVGGLADAAEVKAMASALKARLSASGSDPRE
ncbi:hypothetical protein [Frigidibacter sp. ROC022]|uniref:hypothetical protein n=1 Tax=Frigidibacter sp. ROC022 TaxID=2971796 RepID=UPI00215A5EBA|nr:hypothetical protein [Frigidibacter sp. ROC022]MCR8723680.1 hypothetical protein [Frigidibacter sp. ROC022]